MMKNFKLLCLFLVILFVSTEGAPKGGRGEGGGKLEEVWQALEGTEPIFIMVVCILVVVAVILCFCKFLDKCNGDDDPQLLAALLYFYETPIQIPQIQPIWHTHVQNQGLMNFQ